MKKGFFVLVMAAPLISYSAEKEDRLNFRHHVETSCFNPKSAESQSLCVESVKLLLLQATMIGQTEASCFGRLVTDPKICSENKEDYQRLIKYVGK